MGLFDFFKPKKQFVEPKKVLLAIPMFNNGETFDLDSVVTHLQTNWNINVTDIDRNNYNTTFSIQGEIIALATVTSEIPWSEIRKIAKYAYNWSTAIEDLKFHDSHVIAAVVSNNSSIFERSKLLTKVLSSIFATSNAIGVLKDAQYLLIPRDQYLNSAEILKNDNIPVDLWIYVGLKTTDSANNAYTYGLNTFGKLEMEFIDSKLSLGDIYDLLINICAYVINKDVTFRSGETLGYTNEQKIKISRSKGIFVEGRSLKLVYSARQ